MPCGEADGVVAAGRAADVAADEAVVPAAEAGAGAGRLVPLVCWAEVPPVAVAFAAVTLAAALEVTGRETVGSAVLGTLALVDTGGRVAAGWAGAV